MRRRKNNLSKNKGFTLVELIVVLVILAILAAILVPVLLGYIDEAKTKRYLPNAKACMDAAQAAFVEQYAINGDVAPGTPVVNTNVESNNNGDQDITDSDFAKNILTLAGMTGKQQPYLFLIAVGSNVAGSTTETYDKYTVFYGLYMETANSKPLYFYNNEWSTNNPRPKEGTVIFDGQNKILSGPLKGKRLQYYLISNQNKKFTSSMRDPKFWDWIKEISK